MKQKHHNIFQTNDEGQLVLKICSLHSNCHSCRYIIKEYNFSEWRKRTQFNNDDFIYYLRFQYDIDGLGNDNLQDCLRETLFDTLLKSSEANISFFTKKHFGLIAYFHTNEKHFLSSSLSFEILSISPFPEDLLREVSYKLKCNYYLCECEFSFGSFIINSESHLSNKVEKTIERSLALLRTEENSLTQLMSFHSIVSAGLTSLTFTESEIKNKILNQEIQVMI